MLGTGVGASAPATKCREAGWSVAVVDDQPYGGTCALRGCDPKRVLLGGAEVVRWSQRMRGHGVGGRAEIEWRQLMAFKEEFTSPVPANSEEAFRKLGIETLYGTARFLSPDTMAVGDRELTGRHFVIATGAAPRPLGMPGESLVASSAEFLRLPELPPRIAFVGAGYTSFEFAHLAAAAGATATIFGRGSTLPLFDDDLVQRLIAHSRASGIDVRVDDEVAGVERRGEAFVVHAAESRAPVAEFDLVVHGAGRIPNTSRLALDHANVETDQRGAVVVNAYLQSVSNPRVYAAGDVTLPEAKLPLTPVAAHEGIVVASNLLHGNRKSPNYRGTPSVVFSLPPLASVGMTEAAARAANTEVRVKCGDASDWYASRRTRTPVAMFKTIVDSRTDLLLGAHCFGPNAEEIVNMFAFALRHGIPAQELKRTIYSYPTSASDIPYML